MEIIAVVVVLGTVAILRTTLRRGGGPDVGWSAPAGRTSAAPVQIVAPRIERGTPRDVARALGRVERRHLLRSFSFGIGIAFCVLIVVLFGIVWGNEYQERWANLWLITPILAYPLVGMTIIAVHAAVTRERRDGAVELFAACPASEGARTEGFLRMAWVPVGAVVVFLVVLAAAMAMWASGFGSVPLAASGDVAAALALAVGGTFLGVALGRWTPWWPAPIVALGVVIAVSVPLSGIGEPGSWSQARQLSTWPRYPDYDIVFAVRPVWWHVAWLLALCAAVGVIALLHDRRDRAMVTAAAVTAAALLVTGVATSRPLDAHEAEHVASMVAHPERHQECVERSGASICTYAGFDELRSMLADEVAPVLAGMPAAAPHDLVARQVFDTRLDELDPEVRRRLPVPLPEADLDVPLGFTSHGAVFAVLRLSTGLWAVGLPSHVSSTSPLESIAGEAPGVVALWIAARGTDRETAIDLVSAHPNRVGADGVVDPMSEVMPWPEPCDVDTSPVVWSVQDLAAARALLTVPEAEVRRVLDAEWETWTDRASTTDELMDRFGLPAVGPIQEPPLGEWACSY